MGSVSSLPNGLSVLTQPGGILSSLPTPISASTLQSATPQDVISLSRAAVQSQDATYLFGPPPASQSAVALPVTSTTSPSTSAPSTTTSGNAAATSILPGVAASDLNNATPQEKAAVNDQALQLQQVQTLFNPTLPTSPNINLYG